MNSQHFGRSYLAIPGPSVVPDRVLNAMHQASPNIYHGEIVDLADGLLPDLRKVARTKGDVAIYIGNGHSAWEASLSNVLSRGDTVLVLATGRFGLGWQEAALALGLDARLLDFGRHSGVDQERLSNALKADKSHKIKAVMATHTDTATTIRTDIAEIRACLDACNHPALLMVDCIASLACDPYEMDDWGVDVTLAASQKGLMTPPGLSFLWFSENAAEAHKTADLVTPYWNWEDRARGAELYRKFDGTAPTQNLYGLREALDILLYEEGLEAAWSRHETLARAVWAAVDKWGQDGTMKLNVAEPTLRSRAVTSVSIKAPDGTRIRTWTEEKTGVTLGIGLGMDSPDDPQSDGFFRIAHMGHVNAHMTLGALSSIQTAMVALDIPHAEGALDAAINVIGSAKKPT